MLKWLALLCLVPSLALAGGIGMAGGGGGGSGGITVVDDLADITIVCPAGEVSKSLGAGVWECDTDNVGSSGAELEINEVVLSAGITEFRIGAGDSSLIFQECSANVLCIEPSAAWPVATAALQALVLSNDGSNCPGVSWAKGVDTAGNAQCDGLLAADLPATATLDTEWDTLAELNTLYSITIVTTAASQTLTNKTLTAPIIADYTAGQHDHGDADDGGTLNASAIAAGTLPVARGGTNATSFTAGRCIQSAADGLSLEAASGACATPTGNIFETMNAPAGTDPVADSATDTLNYTCGTGLTCTGSSSTDTLDFDLDDDLEDLVDGTLTGSKVQAATTATPGAVSALAQSISGLKTFLDGIAISAAKTIAIASGCTIDTGVSCPGTVESQDNTTTGNVITLRDNDTNLTPNPSCADYGTAGMLTIIDIDESATDAWVLCNGTTQMLDLATGAP